MGRGLTAVSAQPRPVFSAWGLGFLTLPGDMERDVLAQLERL